MGIFDNESREPGFDEDGNPVTVEAAQKHYHKNLPGSFFPDQFYASKIDAKQKLVTNKLKI